MVTIENGESPENILTIKLSNVPITTSDKKMHVDQLIVNGLECVSMADMEMM